MQRQQMIDLIVVRSEGTPEQLQDLRQRLSAMRTAELDDFMDKQNLALIRAESERRVAAERRPAEVERAWIDFFRRHPELVDRTGNRQMLFNYALSLSDDGVVTLKHLDEAAATLPGLIRQKVKQPLTTANLKQDEENLQKYCRASRLQPNTAALNLLREKFGAGFDHVQIEQALQSGLINLGPASDEALAEWAQEDEEQRQDWLVNQASPAELRAAAQVETEQRRQEFQRAEQERSLAERAKADAAYGYPPLPEIHVPTGERIDAAWLNRISNTNLPLFKALLIKHGNFALTQRLRGLEA